MTIPADTGGGTSGSGGPGGGGGPGEGPGVNGCCLQIELETEPRVLNPYIMIFRTVNGVRYIYNFHTMDWESVEDFQGASGFSGYNYNYGTFPLDTDPYLTGQFSGEICHFSTQDPSGGGAITIEYWNAITPGSADRSMDEPLGDQNGFYDDGSCTYFDTMEEYQTWRSTHQIQFGDDNNETIHQDAMDCCANVAEILRIVRNIQAQFAQLKNPRR